jgi:ketosteroid isomerase-like protein
MLPALSPARDDWMKNMNRQTKNNEVLLDPGLRLRSATWGDLEAVAQLIYDTCAADGDTIAAVTPGELKHEWQTPGFALERDAFLVETADGRIVGFEEFNNSHAHATL